MILLACLIGHILCERKCTESETLAHLRQELNHNNLAGYIIPSEDAHLSEYVAPEYRRRQYMTGLAGSAGIAIVIGTKALVSTDSRYCIQADVQVYCNWDIHCPGSEVDAIEYIIANSNSGDVIGANPFLFTPTTWSSYSNGLAAHG